MSLICSLIIEFPPPTGGDLQDWRVLKGSEWQHPYSNHCIHVED